MKKCHYCAKEIDYSEMYCSKECEEKAKKYYDNIYKRRTIINIIYIAGSIIFALGVFLSPIFTFWALFGMAAGAISTGIVTILHPYPTEEMIKKHQMKKAQKNITICGIVITSVGVIAFILGIIQLCI